MAKKILKKGSIGVFDSGFGGLEILREIIKKLPQYHYIYLGDTARAPYGNCSQEEVYNFTKQAVDFLFKKDCHLIVIACNTVSSEALRKIQREYLPKNYSKKRVLGVIIPAAEAVENIRIGVMATQGTVNSGAFERELKKLNPQAQIFQQACYGLVDAIERGEYESQTVKELLKRYLNPLIKKEIDTLILGCTHYGLLENQIREIIGNKIKIISEGKIVAEKLKDYLERHPEMENVLAKNSKIEFLTTDLSNKFKTLGTIFFGKPISPKKISL